MHFPKKSTGALQQGVKHLWITPSDNTGSTDEWVPGCSVQPRSLIFCMDTGVPHVLQRSLNCSTGTNPQPVFMIPTTSTCISPDGALLLLPECNLVFWWDPWKIMTPTPGSKTVTWHLTDPNLADDLPGRQMARVLMKNGWNLQHLWAEGSEAEEEAELILCCLMCWETMGMDVVIKPPSVKVPRWQTAPFECRWHCNQAFREMACFVFVPPALVYTNALCGNILKHWASHFSVFNVCLFYKMPDLTGDERLSGMIRFAIVILAIGGGTTPLYDAKLFTLVSWTLASK